MFLTFLVAVKNLFPGHKKNLSFFVPHFFFLKELYFIGHFAFGKMSKNSQKKKIQLQLRVLQLQLRFNYNYTYVCVSSKFWMFQKAFLLFAKNSTEEMEGVRDEKMGIGREYDILEVVNGRRRTK